MNYKMKLKLTVCFVLLFSLVELSAQNNQFTLPPSDRVKQNKSSSLGTGKCAA